MNIDLLFSNFDLFNTPEKIQKLKQAILQLAVQGKLVPQSPNDEPASELIRKIKAEKAKLIKEGKLKKEKPLTPISEDEIPYELPDGWEWVRLGEVAIIILGQSPPSSTYNKEGKGLPFYQGKADFGVLYPTPSTWCTSPNKIAISGDILISVRAPVGPTNLCSETSCIGRGLSAIRMILDNSNFYFLYFLKSIEDRLSGKGFGTTFNAVTRKDLNNILTPLPPVSEQQRIEKVDQLMKLCDELESKIGKSKEDSERLVDAILHASF